MVKRESINVQFELPSGSREYDIKAGSNLRGEMMRLDVPVRTLSRAVFHDARWHH